MLILPSVTTGVAAAVIVLLFAAVSPPAVARSEI
jgi:hypothetical protein